jgi:hypothetical protein
MQCNASCMQWKVLYAMKHRGSIPSNRLINESAAALPCTIPAPCCIPSSPLHRKRSCHSPEPCPESAHPMKRGLTLVLINLIAPTITIKNAKQKADTTKPKDLRENTENHKIKPIQIKPFLYFFV